MFYTAHILQRLRLLLVHIDAHGVDLRQGVPDHLLCVDNLLNILDLPQLFRDFEYLGFVLLDDIVLVVD